AGHDGARVADQHVDRIAVERERMRDEAVVPGVAHRRVEKAIHDESAGGLVHLVFDGLAAHRNLDDDVDIERRIQADRDSVEPHYLLRKVSLFSVGAGHTRTTSHPAKWWTNCAHPITAPPVGVAPQPSGLP